ncbi:hypothetical protein GOP47_0022973 [Adiantum capillus-veneris]|uniref:Chlorophyll a-b binding protein, chloroplastic n=1 Tax=Adiantum capillus-veneris TaxID=13818 RepID=A0A9D4U6F0_ADICA|nr:hypothetical protein GOP47_0022973 [Adiantum capillus-veneris]
MVAIVASSSYVSSLHSAALCSSSSSTSFSLKSCPSLSFAPSNGFCLICMVTKKVSAWSSSRKMSWLSGVRGGGNHVNPEWLDRSILGDYGFDPLQLGKDTATSVNLCGASMEHSPLVGAQPRAVAPFSFGTLLGTQLLLMRWG